MADEVEAPPSIAAGAGMPGYDSPRSDDSTLSVALSHAWSWFEVHAAQRQNFVNYFLLAITLLATAYVGALSAKLFDIAAIVSLIGILISVYFLLIDLRNRELIRAGERPLSELQARLADALGIESLRILENVERPRNPWTRMGRIIRVMHITVSIAFLAGGIYALAH